ncbi:DUF2190 family protein [Bradyrhizobium sp. SZCCHNR3118]|uniref:DUF2190 family protein n=1 Tax=Bradyrhizobium sp. SZCCHNR3118 TaxID=3057468 RepID=UPI002916F9EE|nr:DUF2190 family protein [Bradyrhizobium sp. SZCCHNR3118]
MQNYFARGHNLTVPAPANVNSGDFLLIGAGIFGCAVHAAASGANLEMVTDGVFQNVPKATGAAWSIGDIIYWDNTAKNFTKTATNNTRVASATAAALAGDAVGQVKLGVRTI